MLKRIIAVAVLSLFTACTWGRVDPGNVGIVVQMSGSDRGEVSERGIGWYAYSPTTHVYEFPMFTQQYVWAKDKGEGRPGDERMTFSDVNGMQVGADIGIQYQIVPGKAGHLFQTYRLGLEEITHGVLRMSVRNALNDAAAHRTIEAIYGTEKAAFITEALAHVQREMQPTGIDVHQLYLVGAFELPPAIGLTIGSKVAATQLAQQKENELKQVQADVAKQIAAAEGQAKANIAQAQGEAQSKLLRAEAEAKANRLLAESFSPALLDKLRLDVQLAQVQRWSGGVPQVITSGQGAGQILDLRGAAK